jgi:hypothetical protein
MPRDGVTEIAHLAHPTIPSVTRRHLEVVLRVVLKGVEYHSPARRSSTTRLVQN